MKTKNNTRKNKQRGAGLFNWLSSKAKVYPSNVKQVNVVNYATQQKKSGFLNKFFKKNVKNTRNVKPSFMNRMLGRTRKISPLPQSLSNNNQHLKNAKNASNFAREGAKRKAKRNYINSAVTSMYVPKQLQNKLNTQLTNNINKTLKHKKKSVLSVNNINLYNNSQTYNSDNDIFSKKYTYEYNNSNQLNTSDRYR